MSRIKYEKHKLVKVMCKKCKILYKIMGLSAQCQKNLNKAIQIMSRISTDNVIFYFFISFSLFILPLQQKPNLLTQV